MSDKLNRSKILALIIFFIVTISCAEQIYNTEIICPDGTKVLVKYARMDEMRNAMIKALADKKKYHTSETYTVIKLPGNRSFKIEKIPPEDIINCSLRESPIGTVDRDYILYFQK